MKWILLGLWYLFMITLSVKGFDKVIGMYTYLDGKKDYFNAILVSIVWPLTWLIIAMNKVSKVIIDRAAKELDK